MPRVGSSKMMTRASAASHLLSTTFCWVPPERLRRELLLAGGLDGEAVDEAGGQLALAALVGERPRVSRSSTGQRDVLADIEEQDKALALAVLGQQGDAVVDGVARVADA